MAKLTTAAREKLKESSFAIPEDRAYPIHDRKHAINALARVKQHGTPDEKKRVYRAVCKKYPGLPACQLGFGDWKSNNPGGKTTFFKSKKNLGKG